MKRLLIICITIFLTFLSNAQQPNIVFILADDLGYGDLSCYGATDLQTPNIDKLCANGVKFTRAYANSTVCSPSRAAILTGNYSDRVGVPGVIRDMPDNTWGNLADDAPFLPEQLKAFGYHTALIGKWHLGYESPDLPNDRGFDHFKGYVGDMMDDYYTHLRAGVNWMREGKKEIYPKGHATDVFTDWATEYIGEQSPNDKPYFLFLTYNAPHDPIHPPADWLAKVKEREPQASLKRQKLIALIEHLDDGIGKVMEAIEESGEADNTLIIFTSDNGGTLQYGANNGSLKGGKGDLYEGGIRIPCIVNWPHKIKPNTASEPIILMDFYPSLIELAGGNHQQKLPSKSLVNLLKEESPKSVVREMVFMRREGHRFGGRAYYAISNGEYKLMQNSPFESYHLVHLSECGSLEKEVENGAVKKDLWKKLMKHIQISGEMPWR
ncbi:sulfatase-like hydrolase/transferase [Carboxylicivirga marina]|uniref:Sulfatase-like hydrolase/transferase n=1 Tax=Carboxylicivirga marina TaxID=2800988 RepID=A0ABS1HEV1_9BACT|nr:sulfatase-like hydrolase/transferase [Carboxylicivirga marina]MBK3516205.1 sulfatase-like hydrolase/transferase [Carboxylicivirga marina]